MKYDCLLIRITGVRWGVYPLTNVKLYRFSQLRITLLRSIVYTTP